MVTDLALKAMESDGRLVNLAGRQRMLSQRLCKAALLLPGSADPARERAEIRVCLEAFDQTHQGLPAGDPELGLRTRPSPEVANLFQRLDPYQQSLSQHARALLDERQPLAPHLQQMIAAQAPFLRTMEEIVARYEAESATRVSRLRWIQLGLLMVTLGVLVLEARWIFRPAVRQIEETIGRLEHTRAELQASNQLKNKFIHNISHEIRTPLNGLMGLSGLLLSTRLDPRQRQLSECLSQSAESLALLVNDILDFSRLESGQVRLHPQPTDLLLCLEEALELWAPLARQRGLDLLLRYPAHTPRHFLCDGQRVRQVVANLLSNAIKNTPSGHVLVEVSWKDTLQLCIEDTGIGIAQEHHRRIFERFFQLEPESPRQRGGTGLGLAIVEELVERMQGSIAVQSSPGEGSRFCLELPFTPCSPEPSPEPAEATAGELLDKRVLIVDDHPINGFVLREQLSKWGMQIELAWDGSGALERCAQEAFDVILIDHLLPGMDGLTLATQLQERCPNALRIMLSSSSEELKPSSLETYGLHAFWHKPLREAELIRFLRRALTTPGDRSQLQAGREWVLLFDPNPVSLLVARRLFERLGAHVHCAPTVAELDALLAEKAYDLVVLLAPVASLKTLPARLEHLNEPLTPEKVLTLLEGCPPHHLTTSEAHLHLPRLAHQWLQLPGRSPTEVIQLMEEFSRLSSELLVDMRTALRKDDGPALLARARAMLPLARKFGATGVEKLCQLPLASDQERRRFVDELARELCEYQLEVDRLLQAEL